MSTEHPPTIDPVAAARWHAAAPAQSPWLHEEVARRLATKLDPIRIEPADWVDWVVTPEEAAAGFPARPVARPGHEAELKKRTLTNLYNQRPAWLANAHQALDQAVAAAYGWADYSPAMADDEILRRLLKLNLERA